MYVLPLLTVLVSLMLIKKSSQKPYCIIAGILCTLACSIYAGKITPLQGTLTLLEILENVILGNASLFSTLLLFGILIQLITDSSSIQKLTSILNKFLHNKWHFFILLILCALIASVDDYLACIILITIFSTCYQSFKLTKEELCFYINTIVVAFCSTLPISTWAPVINESIAENTVLASFNALRYCFNYFTYFSIMAIFIAFLLKKIPEKKGYNFTIRRHTCIKFEAKNLFATASILYIAYIIFSKCPISFLSGNSLLCSCFLALLFCQITLLKHGNIKYSELICIYTKGTKSMWGLTKFLCLLWIYTDCLDQILGINEIVFDQVSKISISHNLLPFVIFILSGFISYCTGSVFATIRLLIPISISLGTALGLDSSALWLLTSAALNGSLLASVSPLSDTIAICCEEIGLSTQKAYHSHVPYSLMVIALSGMAYLISGYTLSYGLLLSVAIPILVLFPLMVLYIQLTNTLNWIDTFKHRILHYQIYSYVVLSRRKWRLVKQNKQLLLTFKKYTTKPIRIRPLYRFKLC